MKAYRMHFIIRCVDLLLEVRGAQNPTVVMLSRGFPSTYASHAVSIHKPKHAGVPAVPCSSFQRRMIA